MTGSIPKQQCSICGSPDHTHLHCYGMQAQGAISSNEKAPTHEYSPESGWQVFCPRCHCEIKTLKTAPHSEHECILALLAKVQSWEKSCTGRHGSQQPCVSGDSSAPETTPRHLQPRYVLEQIMNNSTDPWAKGVARTYLMHSPEETSEELNCTICGKPLDDHGGMGLPCPLSAPPVNGRTDGHG